MTDYGTTAVEVRGLEKTFGEVVALDGLDLDVEAGTCADSSDPTVPERRRWCASSRLCCAVFLSLTGRPADDKPTDQPRALEAA